MFELSHYASPCSTVSRRPIDIRGRNSYCVSMADDLMLQYIAEKKSGMTTREKAGLSGFLTPEGMSRGLSFPQSGIIPVGGTVNR